MKKELRLGSDEKTMFWGVCQGLAEYFDVDVIFIRAGFLLLLFSGIGLLPYFILYFLMPKHEEEE